MGWDTWWEWLSVDSDNRLRLWRIKLFVDLIDSEMAETWQLEEEVSPMKIYYGLEIARKDWQDQVHSPPWT